VLSALALDALRGDVLLRDDVFAVEQGEGHEGRPRPQDLVPFVFRPCHGQGQAEVGQVLGPLRVVRRQQQVFLADELQPVEGHPHVVRAEDGHVQVRVDGYDPDQMQVVARNRGPQAPAEQPHAEGRAARVQGPQQHVAQVGGHRLVPVVGVRHQGGD
jgi:hypothetical protein